MASKIKSWQIVNGKLEPVATTLASSGRREKDDLERWIRSDSTVLGDDIAIIGQQVQTSSGPMDYLGIDSSGNTVIVELKREMLPREALAQAIDYASDVSDWDLDRFREICKVYTEQTFEDYFQQRFPGISIEDLAINQAQRILLVGFSVEASLGRMIEWLSDKYSVGINAVVLNYVMTTKGDEVLSRTVIIPEDVEKKKVNEKKFIIRMSDEPGTYDGSTLEVRLIGYLSGNLISAQRIRDYLLPTLLEKGLITRSQLRRELVRLGGAKDESQAGYFLSLISNQLGQEGKDYLRQVIHYEHPTYPWEKDNFSIPEQYLELVRSVLERVKAAQQAKPNA